MTDITLEQRARLMFAGHLRANGYACGAEAIELGRHSPYDRAALGAIAEALEAALRLSAGADWQPIETAPLNLDDVLLWDDGGVMVGYYAHGRWQGRAGSLGDLLVVEPTLWQPLPAAPTVSAEGEG